MMDDWEQPEEPFSQELWEAGWAPGAYVQRCSCGKQHIAAKRAIRCISCAKIRMGEIRHEKEILASQSFNRLTPAEDERLSILVEECGETLQIIGKITRHGYESYHPDDVTRRPNRSYLEKEVADILVAIELMINAGDVNQDNIDEFKAEKRCKIRKYLHHQG